MARYYPTEESPFRGRLPEVQPRFSAAREDFLYHLKDDQGRKDDTLRAYWSDLDDLLWWAHERRKEVLKLTRDDLRRYLALQRRRQYSENTIRRRLTALRAFYAYMVAQGVVPAAPTEGLVVRKPQRPKDGLSAAKSREVDQAASASRIGGGAARGGLSYCRP